MLALGARDHQFKSDYPYKILIISGKESGGITPTASMKRKILYIIVKIPVGEAPTGKDLRELGQSLQEYGEVVFNEACIELGSPAFLEDAIVTATKTEVVEEPDEIQ